jgi:hypothetical protein
MWALVSSQDIVKKSGERTNLKNTGLLMFLTNHRGQEVAAKSPYGILANLCDRRCQLSHWDHVAKHRFVSSFVLDHDTGISMCRENNPCRIVYSLSTLTEVLDVYTWEALDIAELFWELINVEVAPVPKKRRKSSAK